MKVGSVFWLCITGLEESFLNPTLQSIKQGKRLIGEGTQTGKASAETAGVILLFGNSRTRIVTLRV